MRTLKIITTAALAGVGAARICVWLNTGLIHVLVIYGKWPVEDAAKASPWILFALSFGLAMSLYGMWAESRQYERSAKRQREILTVAQEQHEDARRDA